MVENYELMPWYLYKEQLLDIYDHRIRNAPELNGSVNTNYCALNEHVLMFFVEKHEKRQVAEEKIYDLVINLRYYYDNWQRAKMFAWLLSLVYLPSEASMLKYRA